MNETQLQWVQASWWVADMNEAQNTDELPQWQKQVIRYAVENVSDEIEPLLKSVSCECVNTVVH